MKINIKNILSTSVIAILATFAGISMAEPWVGPTATAPAENVSAPINTSSNFQEKTGILNVGVLLSNGPVGVGGTSASCDIDFEGVLRYNYTTKNLEICKSTVGVYSWENTTGSGKFIDGTNVNNAVYMDGNVGIGTTNPSAKLHIDTATGTDLMKFSPSAYMIKWQIKVE